MTLTAFLFDKKRKYSILNSLVVMYRGNYIPAVECGKGKNVVKCYINWIYGFRK
jgi:hypothetical protein